MFGAITDIFSSFYSHRFYSGVAHERRGIGGSLIVMLSIIMILCALPWKQYEALKEAVGYVPQFIETLPAITLKDNKLSIDKPSPYTINIGPESNRVSIVIDTNYRIKDVNALTSFMKQKHIVMLVTEDRIATVKGKDQSEIDITNIKGSSAPVTVAHEQWKKLSDTITFWGAPTIFTFIIMFMLVGISIGNLIITLVTGIVVKIVSIVFGVNMDYAASCRIASAFRIPVYIISMLPLLAGMAQLTGFGSWAIWCVYLIIAVYSCKYDT